MLIGGVVVSGSGVAVLVGSNLWQLRLDDEKLERMSEAADSITWMRGSRPRERKREEE
jgi:hypothetical protein